MYLDYWSAVLKDYQEKKKNNTISQRLMHPSPANIRDECIAVCVERYERRDDKTLRTFFGQQEDKADYIQAIEGYPIGKFKAVQNFLKGEIGDPDLKNVELVAWLIDFEPRPFKLGAKYEQVQSTEPSQPVAEKQPPPEPAVPVKPLMLFQTPPLAFTQLPPQNFTDTESADKPPINITRIVILTLLVMLVSAVSYWLLTSIRPQKVILTGCMYWVGDHYQQIPCNQKVEEGTLVIALDMEKLNHFRKITQPDTITAKAIGSVWYIKINNEVEFYTAEGYHPVQIDRRLKPLTDYIISKYLTHN